MEILKNAKSLKKTRFNKFQMVINLYCEDETIDWKEVDDEDIEEYFKKYNFVKQKDLENYIIEAEILSKKRTTTFLNFKGQLERGKKEERPHWQVYLLTTYQTSPKHIVEYFSERIFSEKVNKSIQVIAVVDEEASISYVEKEGGLFFPFGDWSPGRFSKESVEFRKSLEEDEVMREIFKNPRIYQDYLLKIIKSPSDDRLIYWVMDFAGYTGKSKFTSCLEKAGLIISADIDNSRALSKEIIVEAQQYQSIYRCDPPALIIDLSRQVPASYLDGFYGVLEKLKNGTVRSMFQGYSKYVWKKPPHVIVFANMPPFENGLSKDRLVLLEILGVDYNFAIRRSKCNAQILDYNGKFVKFMYTTSHDNEKIEKGFSDDLWKYELITKNGSLKPSDTVMCYRGVSTPITQLDTTVSWSVLSLILAWEKENKKVY